MGLDYRQAHGDLVKSVEAVQHELTEAWLCLEPSRGPHENTVMARQRVARACQLVEGALRKEIPKMCPACGT